MRATRLDETLFDELASTRGEDLISVFLPTHKKGRDVNQDRIRLKNLLSAVDDSLADLGWKPRQREERLARAHAALDDLEFWEHQEAGLAIYIDNEGALVPVASTRTLASDAFVMPVYMLRPLIAELSGPTLPVLALTKDDVSLFSSSRFGVEEIPADLPSYEEVNWFVDREKERQQHPDMVGTDRSRHGHDPSARRDEDVVRFLREVDSAIERFDQKSPLVVLGDDDVVARFADVSGRATLSPAHSGIQAPFSTDEIMEEIRPLVSEFESDRAATAEALARDQLGVGMAAVDVEVAVPAAVTGRVASLLTDRNAPAIWGRLDKASMEIEVHSDREPGDVDLLDRLVVWARDTGAEVVSTESISDGAPFIATFRY